MSSLSAFGWIQSSLGLDITGEWNSLVNLNVGGCSFSCQRRTFKAFAESSILCKMALQNDNRNVSKAEDGSIIIDRDPDTFRHILNFLRTGGQRLILPDDFSDWELLLEDSRVYELESLSDAIRQHPKYQQRCFVQSLPSGVMLRWIEGDDAEKKNDNSSQNNSNNNSNESNSSGNKQQETSSSTTQQKIELFPPLQLLAVDPNNTAQLQFQGRAVSSVDEAVTILLFTYQMRIETWHRDTISASSKNSNNRIAHTIFFTKK